VNINHCDSQFVWTLRSSSQSSSIGTFITFTSKRLVLANLVNLDYVKINLVRSKMMIMFVSFVNL